MSDDDLIRLAAKAAGIDTRKPWNPLTDDGDALRLAVKLGMRVRSDPAGESGGITSAQAAGNYFARLHDGDPFKATRIAIVNIAAYIGELMP